MLEMILVLILFCDTRVLPKFIRVADGCGGDVWETLKLGICDTMSSAVFLIFFNGILISLLGDATAVIISTKVHLGVIYDRHTDKIITHIFYRTCGKWRHRVGDYFHCNDISRSHEMSIREGEEIWQLCQLFGAIYKHIQKINKNCLIWDNLFINTLYLVLLQTFLTVNTYEFNISLFLHVLLGCCVPVHHIFEYPGSENIPLWKGFPINDSHWCHGGRNFIV